MHAALRRSSQVRSLLIFGLRIGSLAAKAALVLFIARFLSLSDLGTYGLVAGAAVVGPIVMGLGLPNIIARDIVSASAEQRVLEISKYWAFMVVTYLAASLLLSFCLTPWMSLPLVLLTVGIVMCEHFNADAFAVLTNLQRAVTANMLLSLRAGVWIAVYMGAASIFPEMRNLFSLLAAWFVGSLLAIAAFLYIVRGWPWNEVCDADWSFTWYRTKLRTAWQLYVSDVLYFCGQYVDRYLVGLFLGLELTGVYILFWQVGNAVYNLANTGVMQLFRARLIRAINEGDEDNFRRTYRECISATLTNAVLLSAVAGVVVLLCLPYLNQPVAAKHASVLWLVLASLIVRVSADLAGYELYARRYDRGLAISNGVLLVSLTALDVTVMAFGGELDGVAGAGLLAAAATLLSRIHIIRRVRQGIAA